MTPMVWERDPSPPSSKDIESITHVIVCNHIHVSLGSMMNDYHKSCREESGCLLIKEERGAPFLENMPRSLIGWLRDKVEVLKDKRRRRSALPQSSFAPLDDLVPISPSRPKTRPLRIDV